MGDRQETCFCVLSLRKAGDWSHPQPLRGPRSSLPVSLVLFYAEGFGCGSWWEWGSFPPAESPRRIGGQWGDPDMEQREGT